ncbi:MAG: hypothetical protein ABW211_00505, partial [Acidimicrobiia bacterium]
HVATDTEAALGEARAAAAAVGGWLLREAGAPGLDGFGLTSPNAALLARVRTAFDPSGTFGRGRFGVVMKSNAEGEIEGARV